MRRADLYNGETIDGRCEIPAFATAQMNLEGWKPVHAVDADRNVLMAQTDAPVRSLMELKPKRLFVNAKGETIVDFGQNFAGTHPCGGYPCGVRAGDYLRAHGGVGQRRNLYLSFLGRRTATEGCLHSWRQKR